MRYWGCISLGVIGLSVLAPTSLSFSEEIDDDQDALEIVEQIEDVDDVLDEVLVDVQGSIEDADTRLGISFKGDLRAGYLFAGDGFSDFEFASENTFRARWRLGSTLRFRKGLRFVGRIAGVCSSEECSPDFILQPDLPGFASIEDGQITVDELFFHWFRTDRFNVAVGRMETKFITRGGVYSKSLERNDNNNLRVNWTDGIHTTYRASNGWISHLILQHNSKDGPSNVRRFPLDFESSDSRVSYHLAFENLQPRRLMIQRALTLSYLPSSLRQDVLENDQHDNYVGVVGRLGHRWPKRDEGWRIRSSLEIGYAPTTHSLPSAGIAGDGETDGLAWAATVSVMDLFPNHSIGINYARTEAGWLLSPQYASNEELVEVRYMWRPTDRITLDVRGRWRDELRELLMPEVSRDRFDFYARFTWSFTIKDLSR
jgi:hypothetical protein